MNADPWWLPGCLENLKKIPGATLCSETHCTDAQNMGHAICYCQAPYLNGCINPVPNCCSYSATSPFYVMGSPGCYCCCGCFANNTLIAVSATQTREIKEIMVGDMIRVAMDANLTSWADLPIQLSAGTGSNSKATLLRVHFGDLTRPESVISTRDQLFLQPGGKLKRASKLVPGQDVLIRPDGSQAPVLDLTVGTFDTGVHTLATSKRPTTDLPGHLLIANGVVCGDFSLQVSNLDVAKPELMVPGHKDLPEFGTKAYAQRYSHLVANTLAAHAPNRILQPRAEGGFTPFELKKPMPIPQIANSFVTQQQAQDIATNAPSSPVHSGAGQDITNYLFKLFKGFYPGVVFYLDEANELPQAHSFLQYGVPFVIINGGLIRIDVVQFEALAFIIAHQLGTLYGGLPKDGNDYSCTGQADYAALSAIFPYVWFGQYTSPMVPPAIEQITELFGFVDSEHRGGRPGDTCTYISLDCRLSAINAAANSQPLPECAGGPSTATLQVTGAVGALMPAPNVTISFNEALDPTTAQQLGNFAFAPLTPTTSVKMQPDGKSVQVVGEFVSGTSYTATAEDVLSKDQHPLVPGKNKAKFKMP